MKYGTQKPCMVIAASIAAFAFVFVVQYLYNIEPCELCMIQSGPYLVAFLLGLGALLLPKWRWLLMLLCSGVFAAGAVIALYHTGLELRLWQLHDACTSMAIAQSATLEQMRQQLLTTMTARCDETGFTVHGLSMANLNLLFSMCMAVLLWDLKPEEK